MLKGYTTPQEAALTLGYDLSDSHLMAEVALAIEFCEAGVDGYCNCEFQRLENTARTYSGAGNNIISLGAFLRRLESVWVLDDFGGRATQLTDVVAQPSPVASNSGYRWIERRRSNADTAVDNLFESSQVVFPAGLYNIEVTGDWGFTTTEMPVQIKMALAFAVKHFFDLRVYNDLVQMDAGLGRTLTYKESRFGVEVPVHYLPEVSRNLLSKWKNSTWIAP